MVAVAMNNYLADATRQQHVILDPPWLVPARQLVRKKREASWVQLTRLGGVSDDSTFLIVFDIAKNHHNKLLDEHDRNVADYLNHRDPDFRLQWSGDERNELVFEPYKIMGRMVSKLIKDGLTAPPVFDGVETEEAHAMRCKLDASNEMESRFIQVEPYLTPYTKYYVRKQMSTKKCDLFNKEKMKALEWSKKQQQAHVGLPLEAVGSDADNDQGVMASPMHGATNHEATPISQMLPSRNGGLNQSLVTPNLNKGPQADAADLASPFLLPSNHSAWQDVMDSEIFGNAGYQHEYVAPGTNPIPILGSQQVSSPQLIDSAMKKVETECPDQLLWLKLRTIRGGTLNPREHAMRACEATGTWEFAEHIQVMDTLRGWVLEMEGESESVYRFAEIVAAAAERHLGCITHEVLTTTAEILAERKAGIKKMALETRKNAVLRFLSPDQVKKLEYEIALVRERLSSAERDLAKNQVIRGLHQKLGKTDAFSLMMVD